jgi:hypothetical protein
MAQALTTTQPEKAEAEEAPDFHKLALERYDAAWLRDRENVLEGYEDLRHLSGEGQWDDEVRKKREAEGRPCLTENRLWQFIDQITGDIRQRRFSAKAVPVDSHADPETAEIITGMLRYIETRSQAQAIYFQGADQQVQAGRGAWRVTTEYASETTFDQEIRIAPIEDGIAVLFDPDALLPAKIDGMFCFVPVDMSRAAFKKKYPGKVASDAPSAGEPRAFQGWYGEDFVRVAEYWLKVPVERTLLVGNGRVMDLTDEPAEKLAEAKQMVALAAAQGIELRIEKREGWKVQRAVINGTDVLEEPVDWPGRYIPIIPADGKEIRIGRRIIRHGAIRHARDPQRRLNYYLSADTELTALAPKSPFIGTERNFEEFEDEWEEANTENRPYLTYTPDPANGGAAPQRVAPPQSSTALLHGIELAATGLQATTGIYNASLGAQSNETSGKAIKARQSEGDTGSYVYVERFTQALEHTARVIVDLIPSVYDTTRTIRIIGNDGGEELVEINKPGGLAVQPDDSEAAAVERMENDVTTGSYDVVLEVGPSFNTQREEAREGMLAFLQASPELAPVMLDLVAKMQDWPLADEVRERLEVMLPPQIKAAIAEKRGDPPEPPQPPPPPSPEVIAQQQQQQLDAAKIQAEMRKLEVQTQLDLKKLEAESAKIEAEMQRSQLDAEASTTKARVDVFKAQVDHHKATLDHHKALREEQSLAASPEDSDRLTGLEQGVAGIAQATAEALMPAFQALLQQQQVTAQAVAQLTQIALAPTEITHHPAGHQMAGRVAGARKVLPHAAE